MEPTYIEGMDFLGSVGVFTAGTYSIVGEIETAIVLFTISVAFVVASWYYG